MQKNLDRLWYEKPDSPKGPPSVIKFDVFLHSKSCLSVTTCSIPSLSISPKNCTLAEVLIGKDFTMVVASIL